jgi:xanthine dehydrogenase YagR molybdenum-binding subunit
MDTPKPSGGVDARRGLDPHATAHLHLLGLDLDQVRFDLGDSDMPWSPATGGSGLTTSLGTATRAACQALIQPFLDAVADDQQSPLRGCTLDQITATGCRLQRNDDPAASEAYTDILARRQLDELTADGDSAPLDPQTSSVAPAGPFAAKFVEVRIDSELGLLRIARVVSAIDGGRILNEQLARSQIIGGTVGGIGQAIFEDTISDADTGRIANVYHATGGRLRSLPITIDQLL